MIHNEFNSFQKEITKRETPDSVLSSYTNMQTVEFEEPKPNIMNTSKIPQFKTTLKTNGEKQIGLKSKKSNKIIKSPRMNLPNSHEKNTKIKHPIAIYECNLSPSAEHRGRTLNTHKMFKIEHSNKLISNIIKSPKNRDLSKQKLLLITRRHKANFSSLSGKGGYIKHQANISVEKKLKDIKSSDKVSNRYKRIFDKYESKSRISTYDRYLEMKRTTENKYIPLGACHNKDNSLHKIQTKDRLSANRHIVKKSKPIKKFESQNFGGRKSLIPLKIVNLPDMA